MKKWDISMHLPTIVWIMASKEIGCEYQDRRRKQYFVEDVHLTGYSVATQKDYGRYSSD